MDSMDDDLEQTIRDIGLPSRPEILFKLDDEINQETPDFRQIERLISADMGLSAALIKIINSPFYGLQLKVTSIRHAIGLLGLSSLTRIVTGIALRNLVSAKHRVEAASLLEESALLALVSSYLANRLRLISSDLAFTYGLFQNCGTLLLLDRIPDYMDTQKLAKTSHKPLVQLEQEAHGMDHAKVGSLMAQEWGLHRHIILAIRHHHEYDRVAPAWIEQSTQDSLFSDALHLIAVGLMAERVMDTRTGDEGSMDWQNCGALILERFNLDKSGFQGILEESAVMLKDHAAQ